MEILVATKSTNRRKFYTALATLMIKELKLERSRYELMIMPKRGLVKERGYKGVTGLVNKTIAFAIDCDLSLEQTLITFAHEMIHVKQLAKGTLRYYMDGDQEVAYWCGKKVDLTMMAYIDRPWELEAYKMQEVLLRRI